MAARYLLAVKEALDIRRRRSAIAILGGVLYLILYVVPEFLPVVMGHLPIDPYEVGLIITTFVIFVLTTHLLYASIQGSRLSPSRVKSAIVRVVSAGLAVVLTIALFFSGLGISGAFLGVPTTNVFLIIADLVYSVTTVPAFTVGHLLFGPGRAVYPVDLTPIFAGFTILFLLWALIFALLMRTVKTK